jgi:hypothetical protein
MSEKTPSVAPLKRVHLGLEALGRFDSNAVRVTP